MAKCGGGAKGGVVCLAAQREIQRKKDEGGLGNDRCPERGAEGEAKAAALMNLPNTIELQNHDKHLGIVLARPPRSTEAVSWQTKGAPSGRASQKI
jgi:hypothetical protein